MDHRVFFRAVVALVLSATCFSCVGTQDLPRQEVIGPHDYIAVGLEGVERYVAEVPAEDARKLRASLLLAEQNVVQIEFRRELPGSTAGNSSYAGGNGTGFVVGEGGDIVTAGHVIQERSPGTQYSIYRAGRKYSAVPQELLFDEHDFSHLDIGILSTELGPDEAGLPSGTPNLGELVVVAGFPGGYGISERSTIVKVDRFDGAVKPIPLIARVESLQPYQLELVAGSMPRGGLSGSPLINMTGEYVGILSGTGIVLKKGSAPIFRINASEIDLQALKNADGTKRN